MTGQRRKIEKWGFRLKYPQLRDRLCALIEERGPMCAEQLLENVRTYAGRPWTTTRGPAGPNALSQILKRDPRFKVVGMTHKSSFSSSSKVILWGLS